MVIVTSKKAAVLSHSVVKDDRVKTSFYVHNENDGDGDDDDDDDDGVDVAPAA